MMKQILALLSWGLICIPKEPEAFTFAKMEVGHPVNCSHSPEKMSLINPQKSSYLLLPAKIMVIF